MAFTCQTNTEKESKDTSTKHLDSWQAEKSVSDQLILTSNKELESLDPENLQAAYVKLRIHCTDPFSNHPRAFTDLPPALVSEILNFLDPKELGTVSCVSTSLYKLSSEHRGWKKFYSDRWGHPVNSLELGWDEKSWKELFVEREFRSKTFMGRYSIDTLYGHSEAVRTVFVLVSKKLVFSSGYDQVVRMWDMEEGLSIAASRPLGCTIRAVAADLSLLVAGGTDGFIHGWHANDENSTLFDLGGPPRDQKSEFRLWEHMGPITCLALDFNRIYSGSWDMSVRLWDRTSLKCLKILMHSDWVWSLAPHDTTIGCTAGSSVHIWETNTGNQLAVVNGANVGNVYSLARSHTGKLLFSGGEDGSIHMFEITEHSKCKNARKTATWIPHSGPVYSLAFEFPWLVSASSDGRISLINVRELLKTKNHFSTEKADCTSDYMCRKNVEPPQRMLHGFGCNLFSVGIGFDRIVCGGEEGIVRIWNFSQALDIEKRIRALRGKRIESRRMRRCRIQQKTVIKGGLDGQCSFTAKKNQMNGSKNEWHSKRRVSGKGR